LSTGDTQGVGPSRPAPEIATAPAGQSAAAGREVRPRGRRFSGPGRQAGRASPLSAASRVPDSPPEVPRTDARDTATVTSADAWPGASAAAGDMAGPDETVELRGGILPGGGRLAAAERLRASEPGQEAEPPPVFLVDASRATLAWAHRRYLGLTSACGISVALAGCAAAWFSAGTTSAIVRGVAALWASYLVLAAGRTVAALPAGADGSIAGNRRQAGPAAWLAALGSGLAEAIVYFGLVAGVAAEHWPGSWQLGVTVLGLVAVRNVMTVCSTPYGFRDPPGTLIGRIANAIVTMPAGGRILVIGVVAPIWGARIALVAVVAWAISSVGYGLAGRAAADVLPEGTGPADGGRVAASATLLRLRDDGALARGLGALVRGNLLPLPPAVLSLAAVSALAALGLHSLPGALTIGPAIVMLLAAPGSANPHGGRLDWLVPVLLLGAQVLYLAAAGEGARVPGPVIFALVASLVVRYAELASSSRPVFLTRPRRRLGWGREYGTELGWEGRVLIVGVAIAMGVATAVYLALAVYLAMLVGAKVVRSCLATEEGLR
jgi:hypothetical protein